MTKNRFLLFFSFALLSLPIVSCKPRCPITSCHVRMVHMHGESEFRGQPFYKKQNPKIGEKLPKPTVEEVPNRTDKSRNKK